MTQAERRLYLIRSLLNEKTEYQSLNVPRDAGEQRKLLRSMMNVRMPKVADEAFLHVQDEYLQQELADEGITDLDDLRPVSGDLYLWQGDITRLKCGAIVNAANSGMTGCYISCHACIDNCIHTFAGVQLRQDCAALMAEQGHEEPTGQAKITKAYNLPCDYVLHTVGPIVSGRVTREDERLLASCYRSCLELAEKNSVRSIAFCCISTGVFHFPNERAAEIAVDGTVYRTEPLPIEVVNEGDGGQRRNGGKRRGAGTGKADAHRGRSRRQKAGSPSALLPRCAGSSESAHLPWGRCPAPSAPGSPARSFRCSGRPSSQSRR